MNTLVNLIIGILQIVYLVLKNKFERDESIKKEKEALRAEVKDAIASGDPRRVNAVILRLRS